MGFEFKERQRPAKERKREREKKKAKREHEKLSLSLFLSFSKTKTLPKTLTQQDFLGRGDPDRTRRQGLGVCDGSEEEIEASDGQEVKELFLAVFFDELLILQNKKKKKKKRKNFSPPTINQSLFFSSSLLSCPKNANSPPSLPASSNPLLEYSLPAGPSASLTRRCKKSSEAPATLAASAAAASKALPIPLLRKPG